MVQQDNHARDSARLEDAAARCKKIEDSLRVGVDKSELANSIGKPSSVTEAQDLTREWLYQIDEGVYYKVYIDAEGVVEGYEFSGFKELFQILGHDFSGAQIQTGDSD